MKSNCPVVRADSPEIEQICLTLRMTFAVAINPVLTDADKVNLALQDAGHILSTYDKNFYTWLKFIIEHKKTKE